VAHDFQTGNNKIKLLMEYEGVTQKVSLPLESILQNAKQLQHARLSWHPHIGLVFSENFLTCIFLDAGLGVMDQFRGHRAHLILRCLVCSCGDTSRTYLQDTPVISSDELNLRIVAAIETVTPQMLQNTWREIEYRLYILRTMKVV
jgi:hypothetical protein